MESTHECEIENPKLPQAAIAAHVVPGLVHTSLISIKMIIDAGCKVTYDTEHVRFFYRGNVVWKGTIESLTGLWVLPLTHHKKCPIDKPLNRQPHGQKLLPNDVKRGTHKISTPMPFLSSQIDNSQSNNKQSIVNMARPHNRSSPKIPPRVMPIKR